jgi:hypothetical protein
MTNHARNGAARERRVRDHLIKAGWELIARSAGSKGPADLVMAHPEHGTALLQVGTGNKRLGPADRGRLLHAAALCAALPILATATRAGITYWWVGPGTASTWTEWSP